MELPKVEEKTRWLWDKRYPEHKGHDLRRLSIIDTSIRAICLDCLPDDWKPGKELGEPGDPFEVLRITHQHLVAAQQSTELPELKRFRATVYFEGYDNAALRASGLPSLPERIRECLETHPTASFRIDSVEVDAMPLSTPTTTLEREAKTEVMHSMAESAEDFLSGDIG